MSTTRPSDQPDSVPPVHPARPEISPIYRHVTELRPDLVVARRPHVLTLFAGEEQLHLDLAGRLHRAWLDGVSHQRGLDGRVRRVRIERLPDGERWLEIDLLERDACGAVFDRVQALTTTARRLLPADAPEAIAEPLALAPAWDRQRYAEEAERFDRIYDPIPILPPDQTRALVLQATAGCSWNRCHFCHLYRDTRFRVHSLAEFRTHVRDVVELVGAGLPLRRGIFIGQANALVIEQQKITAAIHVVREELAEPERWPLGSFVDSFTRRRTLDEWRELSALGLESVALGLESGSAAVLDCLGKPSETEAAIELVGDLGAAGIRRGVIVLIGAGGERQAEDHVESTIRAVIDMRLGRRDRIYLSPLDVLPDSAYARRVESLRLGVLARPALAAQARRIREGLRQAGVTSAIALYDIRRFIY